jgi:hypothetical protein
LLSCGDPHSASPTGGFATSGHSTPISVVTPSRRAIDLGASAVATDPNGTPRFLRATDTSPALPAATATASAIAHLSRLAPVWGVSASGMPALEGLGEISTAGGTIVRVRQVIAGMPVAASAGGELRVMVRKDGTMVAVGGTMISAATPRGTTNFVDTEAGAVARAVRALYKGQDFKPTSLSTQSVSSAGTAFYAGSNGALSVSKSRALKAWIPEGKQLTAAYIVEMYSGGVDQNDGDAYRTVVSADGRILSQTNLKADAVFSYRVFAEADGEFHPFDGPIVDSSPNPTGTPSPLFFPDVPYPAFVAPNLVAVDGTNHPAGATAPDPWLKANATQTTGNNVEAYTDLNAPDGLTAGDFRARLSAAGKFDRTYDFTLSAIANQTQQMAGITSLFFILNWMHDFWYDGGFTEAAGNGQASNYGRGGQDGDAMLGEAQDNALGGSRNNANMSTPADGFNGRMQVFVWDNKDKERFLKVGDTTIQTNTASFAPTTFDVTNTLVVANDGAGASPSDACEPLPADVSGKIVVVDRGSCSFKFKALTVQTAGGVGMVLANNAAGSIPPALGNDATITTAITIPVLSVTQAQGATLKTTIAGGATTGELKRQPDVDLDGSLDASVLAHEFGHFLHHRLSNCNTALCGAMSEGWGDFSSLLVIARAEDRANNNLDKAFPTGIYSTRGFAADPAYFGIRRAPYSTNMLINGFTYGQFTQGVTLPTTFPINGGNPATNNEVHAAGEIWANTMWEGYVALQKSGATRNLSFDEMRLRMRKYVVAGLLLAPTDNTPTEMRDAILAAAFAADKVDHDALAAAYAKRGLGTCAISPDRNNVAFTGITESFDVKGRLDTGVITVTNTTSCDTDAVLDAGETATVKVHVANGGPSALANVAVKLTTAVPGITITQDTATVGALTAYQGTDVTFEVKLAANVSTVVAGDFVITMTGDNGCTPMSVENLSIPLNSDDKAGAAANDTFDAIGTVWTTTAPTLWSHVRVGALNGRLHGVDDGVQASDASFVSPLLAAGTDPVTLTFKHKFSFEGSVTQAFDAGVVEYATMDAPTDWKDITTLDAAFPYNVTIIAGSNPLGVRKAFGAKSAGFDTNTLDTVTANIGTQLSGKMFKIRFRTGSDANTGAPGWDIDDVAFTGLTNKPFPALVPDEGSCETAVDAGVDAPTTPIDARPIPPLPDAGPTNPDDGDGGGCCQTGSGLGAGNMAAALLVLGTVLRRRRRK